MRQQNHNSKASCLQRRHQFSGRTLREKRQHHPDEKHDSGIVDRSNARENRRGPHPDHEPRAALSEHHTAGKAVPVVYRPAS